MSQGMDFPSDHPPLPPNGVDQGGVIYGGETELTEGNFGSECF